MCIHTHVWYVCGCSEASGEVIALAPGDPTPFPCFCDYLLPKVLGREK